MKILGVEKEITVSMTLEEAEIFDHVLDEDIKRLETLVTRHLLTADREKVVAKDLMTELDLQAELKSAMTA